MRKPRAYLCLVTALLLTGALAAQVKIQAIQGSDLEEFLREAPIVAAKDIGEGVTHPIKLTLELGGITHAAVFKSIDETRTGITNFSNNGAGQAGFQDSWKTEVAAYEVDKIIGLGMIPATVKKTHKGDAGSAQFWVDSTMPEAERRDKNIQPPSLVQFGRKVLKMTLFDALIYNDDRHLRNILITKDWEIVLIDHSRSFRPFGQLRKEEEANLTGFSRSLLDGLKRLNKQNLSEKTGNYLLSDQIDSLLKRRDLILEMAEKMVAQRGEAAVLYP